MMYEAIKILFPDIKDEEFVLYDDSDGRGPYIAHWHRPEPQPTKEEIEAVYPMIGAKRLENAVTILIQQRLDKFAQTRGYDNVFTCASYATSKNPRFSAEGQYMVDARDEHWAKCYQIMTEVLTLARPMPTIEEVLAEMPELVWPTPA